MNYKDLSNQTFNSLTVIKDSGQRDKYGGILWECRCECSKITLVRGSDLKSSKIKSCGCKRSKEQSKAGKAHKDAILQTMVEGTNIAVLNDKPTKRNKSGVKGVFWNKHVGKWEARLMFQGHDYRLGQFDTIEEAADARQKAEEKYHKPILERYGKEP